MMWSMTAPLFPTPLLRSLPLSKGGDLAFTIKPKAPTTTWPDSLLSAWVEIDVDSSQPPTRWLGQISSNQIAFKLESTATDPIKPGRLWRLVLSFDAIPTYEQVVVNGKTRRYDGSGTS